MKRLLLSLILVTPLLANDPVPVENDTSSENTTVQEWAYDHSKDLSINYPLIFFSIAVLTGLIVALAQSDGKVAHSS
ncbi:MAG: hypothetical protein SP1CHLAM54_04590 [Chlamydiia bacterium]|nr:hypothetical protein [Chlamydiia bacterium]MCH9615371.1 hypothetical protein [Chlamydiia bacterium]MCH9628307.1 hypothetical protein [Chlamydiia bacterium]